MIVGSILPIDLVASVIEENSIVIKGNEEAKVNNEVLDVPGVNIGTMSELFGMGSLYTKVLNQLKLSYPDEVWNENSLVNKTMLEQFKVLVVDFYGNDNFQGLEHLTGITEIKFAAGFRIESTEYFFEKIKNLQNLKKLDFGNPEWIGVPKDHFTINIPFLPNLEELSFRFWGQTSSSIAPSSAVSSLVFDGSSINGTNLPSLKKLDLKMTALESYDSIGTLDTLEELDVSFSYPTLDNITFLENLDNLNKIDISSNAITDFSPLENSSATWDGSMQRHYFAKEKALTYYEGIGKIELPAIIRLKNDLVLDATSFTGINPASGIYDDSNNSVTLENLTIDQLVNHDFIFPEGYENTVNTVYSAKTAKVNYASNLNGNPISGYFAWEIDVKSGIPPVSKYEVSYESNGGTAVNSEIVELNGFITKPTNPTRAGHTFVGWYKDSGLTNEWNFNLDKMPANNVKLYAKWSVNRTDVPVAPEGGKDIVLESTGMETNLLAMTSIVMMLIMLVATRVFLKRK
ncbi:hypothetical protein GJ496_011880 [Pomphorhynchus laevis]|nr:hypothetical protein GJ496_011880 [Pomphorhynchus laevis]